MDRATTTITTPGNRSIVLNSYLTGREQNQIKAIMYGAMQIGAEAQEDAKKVQASKIPGTVVLDQEMKTLELMLVSLDGTAENVLERVLDLPGSEYDFLISKINELKTPTTPPK